MRKNTLSLNICTPTSLDKRLHAWNVRKRSPRRGSLPLMGSNTAKPSSLSVLHVARAFSIRTNSATTRSSTPERNHIIAPCVTGHSPNLPTATDTWWSTPGRGHFYVPSAAGNFALNLTWICTCAPTLERLHFNVLYVERNSVQRLNLRFIWCTTLEKGRMGVLCVRRNFAPSRN